MKSWMLGPIVAVVVVALGVCLWLFVFRPTTGGISGKVTESDGVAPIAGALVSATEPGGGSGSAITAINGTYLIKNLPRSDKYTVTVEAEGYARASQSGLLVTAGQVTSDVDFALSLGGSISGRVTESDGVTPIAETLIYASEFGGDSGSAISDADGTYKVENLTPGTYELWATAPGFSDAIQTDIAVAAGQDKYDINFLLDKAGAISGKVTEFDEVTPVSGVIIYASEAGGGFGTTISGIDGTYTVEELPTGIYEVSAVAEGFSFPRITNIKVEPGAKVNHIDFKAHGGAISGKVTQKDGITPVSEADIEAIAMSVEGTAAPQRLSVSTQTAADGTYRLDHLQAATYAVQASASGLSTKVQTVKVPPGEEAKNVDFSLPIPGSISGRVVNVKDRSPIPNTSITILDADYKPVRLEEIVTDKSGEYLIDNLSPGTYYVQARAVGFAAAIISNITVVAGQETRNPDFLLSTAGGSISGTIYKSDGETPIENALVLAASETHSNSAYTSADGTYKLTPLPEGTYVVVVGAPGFVGAIREGIAVKAEGITAGVDFVLESK